MATSSASERVRERVDIVHAPETVKRAYRHVTLRSGLRAVLVCDAETPKAAAAMNVRVGQLSDGDEFPGLAHFCEHMLFLGTAKYPSENEYQAFVSQHGGYTNAYTSLEDTNYEFQVTHDQLRPALDRFAQFFIEPLFTESATAREMNAVNEENEKNKVVDSRRLYQLFKLAVSPAHPLHRFGSGNLATLNKPGVREALLAFHREHYTANRMCLAVLGRESLDELETMVAEMFDDVPARVSSVPTWECAAFPPDRLQREYLSVPICDENRLEVSWPVPSSMPFWRSKPVRYITHVLGHEGPGSLTEFLRSNGWVTELLAGNTRGSWSGGEVVSVVVHLTEAGKAERARVLDAIMQAVAMLRASPVADYIYNEVSTVANLGFRFMSKAPASSTVSLLANCAWHYPPAEVLRAPYYVYEPDAQRVAEFLSHMTPDNCVVFYSSKDNGSLVDDRLVEPWYGFPYAVREIPEVTRAEWRGACAPAAMHLPEPNPFLPTDLELRAPAFEGKYPVCVRKDDAATVWHKPDTLFHVPRTSVRIMLHSNAVYETPRSAALTRLCVELAKDTLNRKSYAASLAGLHHSMSVYAAGVLLGVSGYSDKLGRLLEEMCDVLWSPSLEPGNFQRVHEDLVRSYENAKRVSPYEQAMYNTGYLMERRVWHLDERLAAAETLTLGDVEAHLPELWRTLHVTALVEGNATAEDAHRLVSIPLARFQPQALPRRALAPITLLNMAPGARLVAQERTHNDDNPIHALHAVYVLGPYNARDAVAFELLCRVLGEPFFSQLRTREQLGYVTQFAMSMQGCDVVAASAIVQSSVRDPVYLEHRVEAFLREAEQIVRSLSDERLEAFKSSMRVVRLTPPNSPADEMGQHWSHISWHVFDFGRKDSELAALDSVTRDDVLRVARAAFDPASARVLTAHVFGHGSEMRPLGTFSSDEVPEEQRGTAAPVRIERATAVPIAPAQVNAWKTTVEWHALDACARLRD